MKNLINKIHNNDCMNILKQIPDKTINLVIADPPYNITKLKYVDLHLAINGKDSYFKQ